MKHFIFILFYIFSHQIRDPGSNPDPQKKSWSVTGFNEYGSEKLLVDTSVFRNIWKRKNIFHRQATLKGVFH